MNKFKVGQRAHNNADNYFCDILDIKESTNRAWVEQDNGEMVNVTLDNLHETAHDMFVALGYEDKSYTTKGWILLEREINSHIEEIRINKKNGEFKKSKIFADDKKMWSEFISTEELEMINQMHIEKGWL